MSGLGTSSLAVVRDPLGGASDWALVGEALLQKHQYVGVAVQKLDQTTVDAGVLNEQVERVMSALEQHSGHRALTPGGASWLHVQQVPVRRLMAQLLRKLLALDEWAPFAASPGPLRAAPYEGLIGLREASSREYRAYTATWSGVAGALGADIELNPARAGRLRHALTRSRCAKVTEDREEALPPQANTLAVSWSSRHVETLLPVLKELARSGRSSVLLDMATDPADRCPDPLNSAMTVVRVPATLFALAGKTPGLAGQGTHSGATLRVGSHTVWLDRLERLAAILVETAGGCTQPSWRSALELEGWLDEALAVVRPRAVVVSNDTSPLGMLAVHAAERHGAATVHVQHGAWVPEAVAWPALHSRELVVMGERDAALARTWARHPKAEVHVLGQPRFDPLPQSGREEQRRHLRELLAAAGADRRCRIAVWACQPFGPDRLRKQARELLEGLAAAKEPWSLVIAPHPAQAPDALSEIVRSHEHVTVAVADAQVGARGSLAGADALVSVSSTCGIEAVLLDVPVLELSLPGDPTLRLAEHGAALDCPAASSIVTALDAVTEGRAHVSPAARDAVCRWRGRTAADIAELVSRQDGEPAATSIDRTEPSTSHREGASSR
ncbi:hypothetical protein [Streptomyces sp. TS71-3]|uniref:hypothetical protein n=1 Tax=Streptomyces sp. TS71-3 TaxID=2733862 RepID=UPI001B0D6616|nr:hypothetical protein [Streptomyces sp. TS71-3]GHJ35418.1 hypothetical protein Sm713_10270 [Streptomyces sp. TS71-3]